MVSTTSISTIPALTNTYKANPMNLHKIQPLHMYLIAIMFGKLKKTPKPKNHVSSGIRCHIWSNYQNSDLTKCLSAF